MTSRLCRTLLLLAMLAGCADPPPEQDAGDAIVYVIGRTWHTDIALPVEEIDGRLTALEKPFPGVRFLSIGFGERNFLLTRRKSVLTMLAALLPSQSALLVTALQGTPQEAFGADHVVVLHVSQVGLAHIRQRLEQALEGEPVPLAPGPYDGSLFYAATDTYDLSYTCNTWTAEMLRAGGLPMPTAGVVFASQVMGRARWIAERQARLGKAPLRQRLY